MPPAILYYAIPGFVILLCLEAWFSYKENKALYEVKDTFSSIAMGLGNLLQILCVVGEVGADEGHVGMELKGGGGDRGRDRAFDGLRDGRGLGLARSEQENFSRLQNRANAHGDGTARTLLTRCEEFRVVVHRFLAQDLQARA